MTNRLKLIVRDQQFRRQVLPLILLALMIAFGTIGYMLVEGWSLGDALYMTIVTMSTVGYSEVHELDGPGRILTSFLILIGVGALFFSVTNLWAWIVETQMSGRRSQQQIRNRIKELEHHVVVCGFGRVGQSIAEELTGDNIPIVVIEADPQRCERCQQGHILAVQGDATQDATLLEAGIDRARGLAIALDDDAKNVFIALTGRALNPKLVIVARSGLRESEAKLIQAGAHRVVSPYSMSGQRMAALFARPGVIDFIETTLLRGNIEFNLEEFTIPELSVLEGLTVQEVHRMVGSGVTILAIIGAAGLVPSPPPELKLFASDTLIVVGKREPLTRLNEIAKRTGSADHLDGSPD